MELLLYVKTILRIVVIVCTVLTVTVSAITIGIIDNNSNIQSARKSNSSDSASGRDLAHLANNTLAAAAWLVILGIIVLLWEVLHALVPTASSRSSLIQRYTVVLTIADAVFSMGAMLCYLTTGVACAAYADSWGEPPLACNRRSVSCQHSHIKGSNGAAAFFCLLQLPVLLALAVLAIITGFPQLLLCYQKFSKTADEEQLQCDE